MFTVWHTCWRLWFPLRSVEDWSVPVLSPGFLHGHLVSLHIIFPLCLFLNLNFLFLVGLQLYWFSIPCYSNIISYWLVTSTMISLYLGSYPKERWSLDFQYINFGEEHNSTYNRAPMPRAVHILNVFLLGHMQMATWFISNSWIALFFIQLLRVLQIFFYCVQSWELPWMIWTEHEQFIFSWFTRSYHSTGNFLISPRIRQTLLMLKKNHIFLYSRNFILLCFTQIKWT